MFLLADAGQSIAADNLRAATECPDSSSASCYQLYPGLITSVRASQTSSGPRDDVQIASQKRSLHVSLKPSAADAILVQAGSTVSVEWYTGSVIEVWISGRGIPSTSNPFDRAEFGYIGWMLIWLAAFFGAAMLITRRLAGAFVQQWVAVIANRVLGPVGPQVILPGGTIGWSIRPRLSQVIVLPLAFGVIGLVSIRPFMNPDHILIGSSFELVLFAAAMVSLALILRNCRVMADRNSLMRADRLGRVRAWPRAEVSLAAGFSVRGPFSPIACITFIDRDGSALFTVSSLFWDMAEIEAVCQEIAIPIDFDYYLARPRPVSRRLRVALLAISLLSAVALAWSFLPLPG